MIFKSQISLTNTRQPIRCNQFKYLILPVLFETFKTSSIRRLILILVLFAWSYSSFAQEKPKVVLEEEPSEEAMQDQLAKDIQNPVASLMVLPFQNNIDYYDNGIQNTFNLMAILPFKVSPNTNLITRTVVPFVNLPNTVPVEDDSGVGNTAISFLFTPNKPSKLIHGFGFAVNLPASDFDFGSKQFALGPSFVLLTQTDHWTFGGVFQNTWGISNDKGGAKINLFYTQLFVTRSFQNGWYVNTAPTITANWAGSGDKWTIPLGGGGGKLMRVAGKLPVNVQAGYYYFLEHPFQAKSELRLQLSIILPVLY